MIELLELCFRCIQAIQENELPKVTRFDNLTKQAFFCNTLSMVETFQRHKFHSVFIISPRECLREVFQKVLVKYNLINREVLGVIQTECNKEFRAKIHSR